MALDHVGLHYRNYEQAVRFYEAVLPSLGNTKKMEVQGEKGRGAGFGKYAPTFWIHGPPEGADPNSAESSTPTHVAFAASSRQAVDDFYIAAIGAGAKCNGAPGFRDYHPFYYATYVIDMEGNNVEAVNHFDVTSWKVWLPVMLAGLAVSWAILAKL